jgi:hypothetical protein
LQGLAGAGKSTLALQYSKTFAHQYRGIFWASAVSSEALRQDFRDFESYLAVHYKKSFRQRCTESSDQPWLLVVDNLDDSLIFKEAKKCIPQSGFRHVLFTSRRTDISGLGEVFLVPSLTNEAAIALLLAKSNGRIEDVDDRIHAAKIVNLLDCLPLAIVQCGAFVGAQQGSLSEYPQTFDELLARIAPPDEDLDTDTFQWVTTKKILTTWEVSFAQLQRNDEDAAELLSLLGFLDGSDIGQEVIERGFQQHKRYETSGETSTIYLRWFPEKLSKMSSKFNGPSLLKALEKLRTYSLLFRKQEHTHYYIFISSLATGSPSEIGRLAMFGSRMQRTC